VENICDGERWNDPAENTVPFNISTICKRDIGPFRISKISHRKVRLSGLRKAAARKQKLALHEKIMHENKSTPATQQTRRRIHPGSIHPDTRDDPNVEKRNQQIN